jgi:CRP-like cAMP-binding protein
MGAPTKQIELTGAILREIPIFSNFSDEELQQIRDTGTVLLFEHYTNIIVEGELSWGLFLILDGTVNVLKTDRLTSGTYDIAELKKGNYFGEMSLIDENPRSATVRSLTPCELFFVSKEQFFQVLDKSPDLQLRFFKTCARLTINRLRELGDNYVITQYQLWRTALRKEKS